MSESKETIVGTCVVCNREIAVNPDLLSQVMPDANRHKLVHHGYRRPGFGEIVGDCFAVGMPPHEETPDAAKKYRTACESWHIGVTRQLADLRAGKIKLLHHPVKVPVPTTLPRPQWWGMRPEEDPGWKEWSEPVRADEPEPHRQDLWRRLLAANIRDCEFRRKHFSDEMERMNLAISSWEPKPLRERPKAIPDPTRRRRRRRAW